MDFILNRGLRLVAARGLPSEVEFQELPVSEERLSQLAFFLLLFSAPVCERDFSVHSPLVRNLCVVLRTGG